MKDKQYWTRKAILDREDFQEFYEDFTKRTGAEVIKDFTLDELLEAFDEYQTAH
jgi:hypothetical protein